MTSNVGGIDHIARVVIGLVLIGLIDGSRQCHWRRL
jgi:hypothetical protein